MASFIGWSRLSRVFPEQVMEPFRFSRFPETVWTSEGRESPPVRMRFFRARQSSVGF